MDVKKENGLYIPVNIRKRKEYFDGFGKEELIQSIIGLGIGAVLGVILYVVKYNNIIALTMTPVLSGAIVVMFVKKDNTNRSTADRIKDMRNFNKSQKRYYYVYNNIYEKGLKNGKKKE